MGGPAFSTTVEIHMQAHEDTAISTAAPKVLKKFVDDIYSILKRAHFKTFSSNQQTSSKYYVYHVGGN